jgi:hypothetical protein
VGLPQSSSENSANRATISKALPYYAFGVAENSYGWSMRLSQKFASGTERSSDLTAESWPRMPRRHNQAATRETVLERANEIAVGNNSSQAG